MPSVVREAIKQSGVSPKVIASLIAGLIVFGLTKLAIPADPIIEQAVNVLAMVIAGYLAPAGKVEVEDVSTLESTVRAEVPE